MSDLSKATAICLDYLAQRVKVRGLLLTYLNDGIRAQNVEGSMSTGHAIVQDPDGARPAVSDPTGEACWRSDGMRQLLEDCETWERRLIGSANRLIGHTMLTQPDQLPQILRAYRGGDDLFNRLIRSSADSFQRALANTVDGNTRDVAGKSADGLAGCQSCARLKINGVSWWSEPTVNKGDPTDLSGSLKRKVRLCDPCYRFAIAQEPTRLPSVTELRHRHDDPRGHWPTRHGNGKAA